MTGTTTVSAAEEAPSTLSGRIAAWVSALRYEDLPGDVVERTRLLVLDQLGLQLRGATLPNVRPVLSLADAQPGKAAATLAHSGAATTVSQAVWVNGTLGHSAEYDDAHPLAWHTNSAVVPAALALAEREGASGRDLITAVVAGIQVMGLLGAATPKMLGLGWHGSKVLGVFGAAAAAGAVLGLTPAQLADAFGIAGSDAGGTMEYDRSGGEVKRLHAGSASRSGVEAAELAGLGFTGPATLFEGPRGLLRLFGGGGDAAALDAVWDRWLVRDTIVRFYPSVATNHAPLDAIRHLRAEHGIAAGDLARIRVGLVDFAVGHGAAITRPTDAISAQFSLAFSVGLQFVTGGNAPADYFDAGRRADPEILAVGDLVEPYPMPIPEGDPIFSTRVDIELKDGTAYGAYQAGFRGHPSRPAGDADIREKFRENVDGLIAPERADALAAAVDRLETLETVAPLTGLLGVDGLRDNGTGRQDA
ncbi:MmgE/PrpD family protein [Streptomyces sp. TS71-3]|uniref:MmgE/PrpD family protein n=1 Tax=Streptomyces sp. TS71-3 TaxID=2733862 RepID=UPI001B1B9250|nr:MmgE/PrpD family protein [Streptomyces sp. TS71-3]GHJ41681.1 2-methylcitrate dehydratase [Streptomyces sp. TS71-3]